jgi:hypothetical protein
MKSIRVVLVVGAVSLASWVSGGAVRAQEKPKAGTAAVDTKTTTAAKAKVVDPITGTWSMTVSGPMLPEPMIADLELTMDADGKTVSGKAAEGADGLLAMGPDVTFEGSFDGTQITLTVDMSAQAQGLPPGMAPTLTISATLDSADHLTGSFSLMGMELELEGTRTAAPDAPATAGAKKTVAKKKKQKSPEDVRLEKILMAAFDRRPSAVLKAWSFEVARKGEVALVWSATIAAVASDLTPNRIKAEIAAVQSNVTLGRWEAVKTYMAGLPGDHGTKVYRHVLSNLQTDGAKPRKVAKRPGKAGAAQPRRVQRAKPKRGYQPFAESNLFGPDDFVGLADACPAKELDKKLDLPFLVQTLRRVVSQGHLIEPLLARLDTGTEKLGGKAAARRSMVATLLLDAQLTEHVGPYIPSKDEALKDDDHETLGLLVRYYLALHSSEKEKKHLETAWTLNLALLERKKLPKPLFDAALRQAVRLAPQLPESFGSTWFTESFTERPRRGREVLAAIGTMVIKNRILQARNSNGRLANLKLQHTAVQALVGDSSQRVKAWGATLELLAKNWLVEAEFSIKYDQSMRPTYQQDRYGNFYYSNIDYQRRQQQAQRNKQLPLAIPSFDLIDLRPSDPWLAQVRLSLSTRFSAALAKLYLRAKEEDAAFPHIERLAKTHPEIAHELAEEFLRVWTTNHDLNSGSSRTSRYSYMFGFGQRSGSIPLTRSKQERNLKELGTWVTRLRNLPIEEVDEALLVNAFMRSHSSAEVYRMEAMQGVFGELAKLSPKVLAQLAQSMRGNLASVWRDPRVQKKQKTQRKDKEIQAEIRRGYAVADDLVQQALKAHAGSWELKLARASIVHDRNLFENKELGESSNYSKGQAEAFALFAQAAQAYASKVSELKEADERNDVYSLWFYASLGAVDLKRISHEHVPDTRQVALIRDSLGELPGELGERHLRRFANGLFTRMSSVNPAVKFDYLRGGFTIVGDHKDARQAKQVFDYYQDLVTEIKLVTRIDGTDSVSHTQPFGVFVEIRHTKEIERESGGFSKYLVNQNQGNSYSFNYGRPTEDYRDKFEEAARKVLDESFDVLSVTFHDPKVKSRGTPELGWRVTPYAYLMLQARGEQIDKIPALEMDFDFLDTSGYAVLPITSAPIPMDASLAKNSARPMEKLQIVQTLDERRAGEGKLSLEIKATARGLVPELDEILELQLKGAFEVVTNEDQGLSAVQMDTEGDDVALVSERQWVIELKGKEGLKALPSEFVFAVAKPDEAELTYQRYDDADLAVTGATVPLEQRYGETSDYTVAYAAGAAVLLLGLIGFLMLPKETEASADEAGFEVPDSVTPFTVLQLLEEIREKQPSASSSRGELQAAIAKVEKQYFSRDTNGELDLSHLAKTWVERARPPRK